MDEADDIKESGENRSTNNPQKWQFRDEFWFRVTFLLKNSSWRRGTGVNETKIYLAGDFNRWNTRAHEMKPCPDGLSTTLLLSEGFYHYKFITGDEWIQDPDNPHIGGEFGNSIMFVHMDPKVYGLREQHPPHRDYHRPYSDGGHFRTHCPKIPHDISAFGILQRLVFVYLPPSYNMDLERRYPVLYANDGQNLFSTPAHMGGPFGGGWYLDPKLDYFWEKGWLPEFILVAVPNSDFICIGNRNREYCTAEFHTTSNDPYKRYLVEVVKKEVDNTYRTLPSSENTKILGASMGGLCAFTLAFNHPDTFSSCICMSPSFWYVDKNNSSAFDLVRMHALKQLSPPSRVYIDSGDGCGDNSYETRRMKDTLIECGWKEGEDFSYVFDECSSRMEMGVTHSESVWRERVLPALQFAFNYNSASQSAKSSSGPFSII